MRLIIAGATGLCGSEVLRQSLKNPKITSIVALARRPVSVPENSGNEIDASKLKSVVLEDFGSYPEDVKKQLTDADACIWTVAITPTKSRDTEWDEVVRVNHDYASEPYSTLAKLPGETENQVLAFAEEHKIEACVAKPGIITAPWRAENPAMAKFPKIDVSEVAAAMIDQVLNGFEKEPLWNEDLLRIGQRVLKGSSEV
ncbi:hypothetical protein NA57DRAFT_70912 [Rhizodiscina lignyota]|uniref:NAD(P)-binding domain-containing protein n=1 Tax=Rhizodiscina lignyota TaxID=1504668 RepID=A0A9P4IRX0_9PEZI|nr:hypothetical protein NA57DRAFT_70912 [Rhizodiscina lignyota]